MLAVCQLAFNHWSPPWWSLGQPASHAQGAVFHQACSPRFALVILHSLHSAVQPPQGAIRGALGAAHVLGTGFAAHGAATPLPASQQAGYAAQGTHAAAGGTRPGPTASGSQRRLCARGHPVPLHPQPQPTQRFGSPFPPANSMAEDVVAAYAGALFIRSEAEIKRPVVLLNGARRCPHACGVLAAAACMCMLAAFMARLDSLIPAAMHCTDQPS